MLEKFEDFIKHSKRDEDITDLEISKHEDDYKLTYFTTAEGTAQTIEERYSYIQENDTFQLFYKKDIPTTIRIKNLEGNHEEAYQFKGTDDPEFQQVLRWKLRLTPFEYLMVRANNDYPYSTEFLEEIDKEAQRVIKDKEHETFRNLPSITTNRPNVYEIDNTKVIKNLTNFTLNLAVEAAEEEEKEREIFEFALKVNSHTNKQQYVVKVQIDMEGVIRSERHKKNQVFNAFDMEVHNAVCTLISAGNTAMTVGTIYRTMNGYVDGERTPKAQRSAIDASLDKMTKIRVNADFTEHYKMEGFDIQEIAKEGTMIDYVIEDIKMNGKKTRTYKFSRVPIFYEYSRDMEQIQKIPIDRLNLKGFMRMDQVKTVMRNYLLSRIEDMRYRHDRGNLYKYKNGRLNESPARIRYVHIQEMIERIYISNGKAFTNKTWNDRRSNLIQILDAFVDKGIIYYYKELKDAGKFSKVQIYFNDAHMAKELKDERKALHPQLYEK